jgi:hypothetical protein
MKGHGAFIVFWLLVVFIGLTYLGSTMGSGSIEGMCGDSSDCPTDKKEGKAGKKHNGDKKKRSGKKKHHKHHPPHKHSHNGGYGSSSGDSDSDSDSDSDGETWDDYWGNVDKGWRSDEKWAWDEISGNGSKKGHSKHHTHGADSKIQKDNGSPAPMNSSDYDNGSSAASDVTQATNKVATHHKTHHRHVQPSGIPAHMIPQGDEDLYILKSEIVPPVCPACPEVTACPGKEECEPCPPCGRCPEAPFECKKVPNYRASSSSFLPMPILNDFSQFGM